MARNRYEGYCYCCGQYVPVGYGHFERYHGRWRIKCVKCASGRTVRDTDREVKRGKEVFTLMPAVGNDSWTLMELGTLQEMLEGVLFFEEIDEQIPAKLEVGADTLEWLQKRFEVANRVNIR